MDAPLVEGEDSNLYDVLKSGESPKAESIWLNRSIYILPCVKLILLNLRSLLFKASIKLTKVQIFLNLKVF